MKHSRCFCQTYLFWYSTFKTLIVYIFCSPLNGIFVRLKRFQSLHILLSFSSGHRRSLLFCMLFCFSLCAYIPHFSSLQYRQCPLWTNLSSPFCSYSMFDLSFWFLFVIVHTNKSCFSSFATIRHHWISNLSNHYLYLTLHILS